MNLRVPPMKSQNFYLNGEDPRISQEKVGYDGPSIGSRKPLNAYDLPHSSAAVELWNFHAHLNDHFHNQYSVFVSFFRILDNERCSADESFYLHGVTSCVIDAQKKEYYPSSSLDSSFPRYILNSSLLSEVLDPYLTVAYREVLAKGILPAPDQVFLDKRCSTDSSKFYFDFDDNILLNDDYGSYHISCHDHARNTSLALIVRPMKEPGKNDNDEISTFGINMKPTYSYINPRLYCDGKISINGELVHATGLAWYEHTVVVSQDIIEASIDQNSSKEYIGAVSKSSMQLSSYGWYRFSIQLDNGYDIRVMHRCHSEDNRTADDSILLIGPDNERFVYEDEQNFQLRSLKNWISVRTTAEYLTHWKLCIPKQKCDLYIEALFEEQEFLTILHQSGCWNGRANVHGSMNDVIVKGYAFIECYNCAIQSFKSLDQFFKNISKMVLKNIDKLMPKQPNYEQIMNLIGDQKNACLVKDLNMDIFARTMILPVRDITDRGGKAWRSYAFMVCIDCVGCDSYKYEHWLSLAEIVHVGSLIIDDIEDESAIRRGGPACHLLHGTAQAINAGTGAYFMPLQALIKQTPQLTDNTVLKIYEITFLILRAGHIGQALDIYGLDYLMDEVVETGHSLPLENAIICIHRLKSGAPAGGLAHMGALIGGGTTEQCEVLEYYFRSIGIAFQIVDDVLNLRGFQGNTKVRGEDIMAGKITFPIAKAMDEKYLHTKIQRKHVWDTIRSKTTDITVVNDLIALLESCGSIDASIAYAKALVENAWAKLDSIISDSMFKLMLRAFGLYVLERHY